MSLAIRKCVHLLDKKNFKKNSQFLNARKYGRNVIFFYYSEQFLAKEAKGF